MKKLITLLFVGTTVFFACNKKENLQNSQTLITPTNEENAGPYGKTSIWRSIGGDTLYKDKLTLSYFFTEKNQPCNICYYQQNYSLWNDYSYTFQISECANVNDTLTITDIDTEKKAIFKREK